MKKRIKTLGAFLRGEVHKIGRREKLAEKVGRKEKLAEKVGRKEKLAEKKYSAARRIFNSLIGVSSGDETLRLMFDILLQTRS